MYREFIMWSDFLLSQPPWIYVPLLWLSFFLIGLYLYLQAWAMISRSLENYQQKIQQWCDNDILHRLIARDPQLPQLSFVRKRLYQNRILWHLTQVTGFERNYLFQMYQRMGYLAHDIRHSSHPLDHERKSAHHRTILLRNALAHQRKAQRPFDSFSTILRK